jgi:hypothetical protein
MTNNYKLVGPNAQTLFLGCSISEITMNLAWGTENSSCSVKLVKDNVAHELHPDYNPLHETLNSMVNALNNRVRNNQLPGDLSSQELLKPIAKFEKDKLDSHNTIDRNPSVPAIIRDMGKKLWNPYASINAGPLHWLGPDPGFIGDIYSIVGAPCQVRFQDIFFGGFITKWTFENSVYNVDIAGPGSLLRGTKLILNDYYGTVSSRVQNFAVPYGNADADLPFNGNVREGNIPNLINIFGALESPPPLGRGFGGSGMSDFGISAAKVYDMLITLLGSDNPNLAANKFSPYGGLVSRSPMTTLTNRILVPQNETINDVGGGGTFNLTHFGLLRTVNSIENTQRSIYKLDLSSVPRPADRIYLPLNNSMSLDEFISFCCSGAGFDWNTELTTASNNNYTGTIKINTYSRRIQNPPKVLKNFITNFRDKEYIVSYDTGEEYKDQNVRKVIMGGKQERIYQVTSHTLSRYKNAKIYDPIDHRWINVNTHLNSASLRTGHPNNTIRIPLADSQRMYAPWIALQGERGGGVTAQISDNVDEDIGSLGLGPRVNRGNYNSTRPSLSAIRDTIGDAVTGSISQAAYPLHLDLISPYFGRGFDGNTRKVFYDRKRRQLLVNCPLADLSKVFPILSVNPGLITISENEIRSALASFDSWITYTFEPTKYGIWKPIARLLWENISHICGPQIANALRLAGPGILKDRGKERSPFGNYHTGNPISTSQAILFSNTMMPILQGVYNYIINELGQHYGKNYLVRLPSVNRTIGDDGIARYDWEIAESGWEEKGNYLDDSMRIGDINADLLASENGKFGPLLGWNNSQEKNYSWPPIGNIGVFSQAIKSGMRGILKGLASIAGNTDINFLYSPLRTEADGINIRTNLATTDSFGAAIGFIDKFYTKASILDEASENHINKKLLYDSFLDINYCVISSPSQVTIHNRDFLAKTICEDCAAELLEGDERATYYTTIDLQYMFQRFLSEARNGTGSFLLLYTAILDNAFYSNPGSSVTVGMNNEENMPIFPRAAVPCFAAIPVRYNRFLYGPWSTSPALIENFIFPDTVSPSNWSNNIIGGVDLEINPQYVPWEYNGMKNLDDAMLSILSNSNEYQQIEETGKITLAGIMLNDTKIGSRLQGAGPVCNAVVVTFGSDGIKTTYSFRTFSRKLGYFNLENAQNIEKFAKQSRALRTQLIENINNVRQQSRQGPGSSGPSYFAPKSMSFSPVSVLVGGAYPFLHKQSSVSDLKSQCQFDPGWPARPVLPNNIASNPTAPKHFAAVSLYDPAELDRALFKDEESYAQKSVMSLDGIFSPVSLYPTSYHSTFPLSKYKRTKCPMCQGAGTYNYLTINEESFRSSTSVEGMADAQTPDSMDCPYCVPDSEIDELKTKGAESSELTPPFLVASGTDREIIANSLLANSSISVINNYNYSPIVISTQGADFSCAYKAPGDLCGHSIDVVGFGNVLPKPDDALRAALSDNPNKNYAYYESNSDAPQNQEFIQNHRFFGLRGPVILHSWGYDLEGFPVPNSSGEYKLNGNNIVRDSQGNPVGKNQILQSNGEWSEPYKESTFMKGWAQQPASWPVGPIDFRWDSVGRVWTIGANYKPVWVVIEHDLLDEDPVRGIVVESSYNNNPLPSGLRKIVFVKDTMGMFSAPRGSALYCRYDSSNGFYEPIYNRPLITSGLIEGGRTATIYTAYTPSMVSEDIVSEYSSVFDNPLNLPINTNTVGLFVFLNGKWILQSTRG